MTEAPLPGLMAKLGIPVGLGYLFQTFFNVVDTFFAGQYSTDALAALSIAFPVFFLVIAASSGISTGATACIAHALGADDEEQATLFSGQTMSYSLIASLLLGTLGWIYCPHIFRWLGAGGNYLDLSVQYMRMIFIGTGFFLFSNALNAPLTASGDTKTFRNTLIIGALINVLLDPLFMYGYGPIPGHGFAGIAASTITIQGFIVIYITIRAFQSGLMPTRWSDYRPRLTPLLELNRNILPATANMATVGIGIFIITFVISQYGKEAVAGYGIATRVEQIALLPGIALSTSALALAGQNFGAGKISRVKDTHRLANRYGLYLMGIGGLLVFLFREILMSAFTEESNVIQYGVQYLFVAAPSLYAYVILFNGVSILQGLKQPMYAIWMGLVRQIVLPFLIFYPTVFMVDGSIWNVWLGIIAINWTAALFTWFYVRRQFRKLENG